MENQIMPSSVGAIKQDSQNSLRSPMLLGKDT